MADAAAGSVIASQGEPKEHIQRRRKLSHVLGLAFVCVIATAPVHAFEVTTSAIFSFTGALFDDATEENVSLSGALHVVTQVMCSAIPPNPCAPLAVQGTAALSDALGVGAASALRYEATGEGAWPPDPVGGHGTAEVVTEGYRLWPPGPVAPAQFFFFRFRLSLSFDAAGRLMEGAVAPFAGGTD
jgi:hypothetical protein